MKLNVIEKLVVRNPIRKWVMKHIEWPKLHKHAPAHKNATAVLDFGCGYGFTSLAILDAYKHATLHALDYDIKHCLATKEQCPNAFTINGTGEQLPYPDNHFDAIYCIGVLHHLIDWQKGLKELHRILKPEGVLYMEEFYKRLICNGVIKHIIYHPQENRFSHSELLQECENNTFTLLEESNLFDLSGRVIVKKR